MVQLRKPKNEIGQIGRKAEAKMAKRMGGRLTRASGNMSGDKGDLVLPDFLIENKSTIAKSAIIQHDWLSKVSREALELAKQPALALQFTDGMGRPIKFGKWVMIPESLFEELQAMYARRD